ncbi:MAG: Unknown protein [uncultured Sulfurovum sp.]|uniref:Uncharacterized protein n=1 Tax=uncultured Sulfurovum sp. TaxID=269237 RepID=A0A6S6TH34_9BACT|nr:MAG: Unknown protein [uncultured Sulfurovum sp.]
MKKIYFLSVGIGLFFNACVMHPTFTDKEKKIADPVNNQTYYGESFHKLNKLIEKFNRPMYRFQVKKIENLTSSKDILPVDSKSFIKTPLILHMKNLKLMAYEPIYNRYETLTTGHVYFPNMKKTLPQLVINGGITQFDKGISSKSANFDVDVEFGSDSRESDLRADRDRSSSISQIALDLSVFRYKDRMYLPGVATKNKIEIQRNRKKNRLGFFLNGSGIGESKYATLQQSKDEALRILTEYSLLQLLGRLYQVPYWTCVTPAMKVDEFVVSSKANKFIGAKNQNQHALIEQLLPLYGYSKVTVDGKLSKTEQKMLVDIANKYKFNTKKVFSKEFYQEMYRHIPSV